MENGNFKVKIDDRTFEDVQNDINEIACLGYNREKAQEYQKSEFARMLEMYQKRADELNEAQKNIIGPKINYVAR